MSEAFDRWRMEESVEDLIDSVNRLAATGLASCVLATAMQSGGSARYAPGSWSSKVSAAGSRT